MAKTTFTFNDGETITIVALEGKQATLLSRVGEDIEFGDGRIHPADEYDILETARSMGEAFAGQVKALVSKARESRALDVVAG